MATTSPQQIHSKYTYDVIRSAKSELKAKVATTGTSLITKLYRDIGTELNQRKFYVKSPVSYEPIPAYYTTPISDEYLDAPITVYYGVKAKSTYKPGANTTPAPLVEPFMANELATTYHTIMELHDLHSKKMNYEIIHDEDVVTIYGKLREYFDYMQSFNIEKKYDIQKLLTSMYRFYNDLTPMYERACYRNKWTIDEDNFTRLLDTLR